MNFRIKTIIFLWAVFVTFSMSSPLFADSGSDMAKLNKQLINKINAMESSMKQFANRIKQLEAKPSSVEGGEIATSYAPEPGGGLVRAAEDIKLSGYVETSYTLNANRVNAGGLNGLNTDLAGVNALRGNSRNNASFVLDTFKLTLEKEVPESGGIGFRTDLIFGEDAKYYNSLTVGAASSASIDQNNVYIENAYGELRLGYGNGIDLYFGRFVTLIGVEVIESKDNWLPTKGYLFNFGMPFAHTGIRAEYAWDDKFVTSVGVNNGADLNINNSMNLSLEAKVSYQLTDAIGLSTAINWGNETPEGDINGHAGPQFIWDAIVSVDLTDKWKLMFESLWGNNSAGNWYGFGVWNRYEFNDWISFNNRVEFLNDSSNARLGAIGGAKPNDDGYDVWEMSWGIDFKVYTNLLARLEYRFDAAPGKQVFANQKNQNQSTFTAQAIYSF